MRDFAVTALVVVAGLGSVAAIVLMIPYFRSFLGNPGPSRQMDRKGRIRFNWIMLLNSTCALAFGIVLVMSAESPHFGTMAHRVAIAVLVALALGVAMIVVGLIAAYVMPDPA